MRQTQRNLFKETTAVGVGPETKDLSFPCMEKIAGAYGIPYLSDTKNEELPVILKQFTEIDGFAMCEVFVDSVQGFEPKPSAMKLADGSLVSPPLEDLAPFLDRDELKIDACTKCEGQMTESLGEDNTATVLITRKGAKKADKELYMVENAKFKALMFGAKTGIRTGDEADKINFDKFTDAAAWLDYELSWEKNNNNVGFLGFDNSSSDKMAKQAGYGKVTKRSTKDKTITTPGDCEDTTETIPGVTCWMVKNIAGSFLADTTYTGICSNFLFDVCDLETPGTTTDAPLPGTFT